MIALGIVFIPSFARVTRSAFAALRDVNYVKSARLMGASSGRILVRPSGTEALMRVMVEAKTEDTARQTAQRLAQMIPSLAKE